MAKVSCLYCDKPFDRRRNNHSFCSFECRFWGKVNRNGKHGCWLWTGSTKDRPNGAVGYGAFRTAHGSKSAHRISWEINYGQIPKSLNVLHHCDNPPCVNPSHLFLGNQGDNMADMKHKKRRKGRYCGERHYRAKIQEEQVREIRARYKFHGGGNDQVSMAKEFKVTQSTISAIVLRKSWASVTG